MGYLQITLNTSYNRAMEIAAIPYCSGDDMKGSIMYTEMHALRERFNLRQVGSAVVEEVGAEGQLNMATVK